MLHRENITRLDSKDDSIESQHSLRPVQGYIIHYDKPIGVGAFSKVYLCSDSNHQQFAVKIMNKDPTRNSRAIKAARSQAKILQALQHPNAVAMIKYKEADSNIYMFMRYYNGRTFRQILQHSQFRLTVKQVLDITVQLASVLNYLHSIKIVHRDIKPDNIKYFKEGKTAKVVLLDFGFAKKLAYSHEQMSEWIGTPKYMSPEMLECTKYDSSADIWSFGILIYQLLYYCMPWEGEDQSALLANIKQNPLTFPKSVRVPPKMKQLITSCLQIDRRKRMTWHELGLLDRSTMLEDYAEETLCDFCCYLFS